MADPLCGSLTRIHNYYQSMWGTERAEIIWERQASHNPGDEERIWTEVHLATRFLTSLESTCGVTAWGWLQLCTGPCSQGEACSSCIGNFDSWECVLVGNEGPGKEAAWVLRSSWLGSFNFVHCRKHPGSPTWLASGGKYLQLFLNHIPGVSEPVQVFSSVTNHPWG